MGKEHWLYFQNYWFLRATEAIFEFGRQNEIIYVKFGGIGETDIFRSKFGKGVCSLGFLAILDQHFFVPHLAFFYEIWPAEFENGLVLREKLTVSEIQPI